MAVTFEFYTNQSIQGEAAYWEYLAQQIQKLGHHLPSHNHHY